MRFQFFLRLFAVFSVFSSGLLAQNSNAVAAAPAEFDKEALVVESLVTKVTVQADGANEREQTLVAKIKTDAGVKRFAVLSFPYTTANDQIDVEFVQVRKPDGTVVKTPDYNVQDMPADVTRTAPMYSDIHEKHVAVKGLGVGDQLEYKIRQRTFKPQVPGQFWFEYSFEKDLIVREERLEVTVPATLEMKISSRSVKPEVAERDGHKMYVWKSSTLNHPEEVSFKDQRGRGPLPSVQLSTFKSWEEVGRFYSELQRDRLEITPAIRAKAAELTKGLTSDRDRVRAIYDFVALKIHYVGLSFGVGRYQPHAADDVLGNEYGDCKDKHTLLSALLKAAGYDAYPVLINSSRLLEADVPSLGQFDHVITAIPLSDKLIFADSTTEVAPIGVLLAVLRGKDGLVIPISGAPRLIKTPNDLPFPRVETFEATGALDENGKLTAHMEETVRGDAEVELRAAYRSVPELKWKDLTQVLSYRWGFGGEVQSVKVSGADELDNPIRISYDYERKKIGQWDERKLTAPLPVLGIELFGDTTFTDRLKKPKEPLWIGVPGELTYTSKVKLPADYSIVPPEPVNIIRPYAEYHIRYDFKDSAVLTVRRFVLKQAEIAPSEWDDFRKFCKEVSDDESNVLSLVERKAARSNAESVIDLSRAHSISDAQAILEKSIAENPNAKGAHYKSGVLLSLQARMDEAISEFQKEEKISPDNLQSYWMASQLLDVLRRHDEAVQELRNAMKALPNSLEAPRLLSELLLKQKKYPEAIELLEKELNENPNDPDLETSLGTAYLQSGQKEKATREFQNAAQESPEPRRLNSIAYTLAVNDGDLELAAALSQRAVGLLEARSASVEEDRVALMMPLELAANWDTLGWVYFQKGDMKKAESFLRASWLLAQDPETGDHLAQVYEKQGRKAEAEHTYWLALAAQKPIVRARGAMADWTAPGHLSPLKQQIEDHYVRLTGKKAEVHSIRKLPNGQWTMMPGEELSRMRSFKVPSTTKYSGSATFRVVFAPEKVESARFESGAPGLEPLTGALNKITWKMQFPEGSTAKVLRRVMVVCSASCDAVLMPIDSLQ